MGTDFGARFRLSGALDVVDHGTVTLFGIALRTWSLALIIVAATLALRQPTWNDHILFIDETIYYSFGARLELPGAHVHTHTFDMKPPGGPMTYWLAIKMSPQHAIAVVHIFTTIAIGVDCRTPAHHELPASPKPLGLASGAPCSTRCWEALRRQREISASRSLPSAGSNTSRRRGWRCLSSCSL